MEKDRKLSSKNKDNFPSSNDFKVTKNYHNPKRPIKISGPILIPDKTKSSDGNPHFDRAVLTLVATPEDWQKLRIFYLTDSEEFTRRLWTDFIYPAYCKTIDWRGSGRSKPNLNRLQVIKTDASELYSFFIFWTKIKREDWPNEIQEIFRAFENGFRSYSVRLNRISAWRKAAFLTFWCLRNFYGKAIENFLNPDQWASFYCRVEISDNFFKNYCNSKDGGPTYIETRWSKLMKEAQEQIKLKPNKKFIIIKETLQKIANLIYDPPLSHIFYHLSSRQLVNFRNPISPISK